MVFYYSDTFDIPLPPKHRFPGGKYSQLRQQLLDQKILHCDQLKESPLASQSVIAKVHQKQYVEDFFSGQIDEKKMKRIGFPWSPFLVRRIQATMGGAIEAAKSALEHGISGQLAGGTHHAHFDYGGGYCIFNDFAIAADQLISQKKVNRVAIVDLDVHQGDGNASLLKDDPNIFVLSLHGAKNYPFRKFASDLDIGLPDKCDDETYLEKLNIGLDAVDDFNPDIVLYQAGVDILEKDKLGRLSITLEGLWERDLSVFSHFKNKGIPVSMAIGGGYSDPIEHSIKGYVQTFKAAKEVHNF